MMPLTTTVIGVFPKPDYLDMPVWYKEGKGNMDCNLYEEFISSLSSEDLQQYKENLKKAQQEVINTQDNYGIDVITDGEVYRDVYIYHFLRHLEGVDFKNPQKVTYRNGACTGVLPVINGPVRIKEGQPGFMAKIWRSCQALTVKPVKVTLPGPMTITNTTVRQFYKTKESQCWALAECLKQELLELADAGCKYIQIDEPLFARLPEDAMNYGISVMSDILSVLPSIVYSTVHICCGYTDVLDQVGFLKANPDGYTILASHLDEMGASAISLEAAYCQLDLSVLARYKKVDIVLGVVAISKSRIESVEEIQGRVTEALQYIDKDRLTLAPDCGLGLLPKDVMHWKLMNMVAAARLF